MPIDTNKKCERCTAWMREGFATFYCSYSTRACATMRLGDEATKQRNCMPSISRCNTADESTCSTFDDLPSDEIFRDNCHLHLYRATRIYPECEIVPVLSVCVDNSTACCSFSYSFILSARDTIGVPRYNLQEVGRRMCIVAQRPADERHLGTSDVSAAR